MGLFKFQNYSAIKNAQDNPRVEATVATKNGYVFGIEDDEGKELQEVFENAAAAQGEVWVAMNIVDKPEVRNYADYTIEIGEYIRAVKLNNLVGEKVELSSDLVIDETVAVGDTLVPTNETDDEGDENLWKKAASTDGYSVYLEVTKLTPFGTFTIDNAGVGYEAKIKQGAPVSEGV